MKYWLSLVILTGVAGLRAQTLHSMHFIPFSQVRIDDQFWAPKQQKVATATMDACIYQTEINTPRIRNFEKVARHQGEKHEGIYYDDSDVYKALEAMSYAISNTRDPKLEATADRWIDVIAAAQEPDGYLNTYYSLNGLDQRWTDMEKHEAYCAGHLMEAAVAYFQATGKRKLLDVAIRLADHIDRTFRQARRPWVTGHEEIELALVKLAKSTGEDRYVQLAQYFLDQRGHGYGKGKIWDQWNDPAYAQDAVPVKDQKEITGHAVRAMYLYTGAADVGAMTGDTGYQKAMNLVWEDVVGRNLYVTGGIGSSGRNEGFGIDYELPNEEAYCETCASVGMVFWNQRMAALTGDGRYMDVLERSLYNGALDGLSLTGDHFFYGNPLASHGQHSRREWFGTACCPSNIARLVSSLGDYIYAVDDLAWYIQLFIGSETILPAGNTQVHIRQLTNYPWSGNVRIAIQPESPVRHELRIRIPGWASGVPVPEGLYRYETKQEEPVKIRINGQAVEFGVEKGYAHLTRTWHPGDTVEVELPMAVREVLSRDEVSADRDRFVIQRGPLVYCVEGTDNPGKAWSFWAPEGTAYRAFPYRVAGEPVMAIRIQARGLAPANRGSRVEDVPRTLTAIPYYSWANRGNTDMQVWLPRRIKAVEIR
ncbi:MAG: glycoside hydrolase family 127 protein [Saprospiraceae bacterium]|nr:glycoside hydrolase family 127 protein [Saprospiraceae bacterium]